MKQKLFLIVMGLLVLQTASYADMLQGTVTKVDGADKITINRTDAQRNPALPQQVELQVVSDTKLKNITALTDLKTGSEVKVDAKEKKDRGVWEASSIELINPANKQY